MPEGVECKSYTILCDNHAKNPARWRPIVDQINGIDSPLPPPIEYPPLATQAATAVVAAARFVKSGFATVDQAEFDRRHAICAACEHFDAAQNRCKKCGCSLSYKPWSKAEKCPADPPRW
jgi:hypothetical protein